MIATPYHQSALTEICVILKAEVSNAGNLGNTEILISVDFFIPVFWYHIVMNDQ